MPATALYARGTTLERSPLFPRIVVPLALLVLALAGVGCGGRERPPYAIDLGGEHRLLLGDDPSYAAPEFDDSSWPAARVPGTWQVWSGQNPVGWYRIHFDVPEGRSTSNLALDLGAIGHADECFVNGRLVGRTGSIDRVPALGYVERVYPLPDDVLRPGANVVSLRVRTVPISRSGFFGDRIGIGDRLELSLARADAMTRAGIVEGVLVGFLLAGWLLVAFFPKRGRTGKATLFLWAAFTLQILQIVLVSRTAHAAGWTQRFGAEAVFAVLALTGCANWAFGATLVRGGLPRPILGLVIAQAVVAVVLLAFGARFPVMVAGLLIGAAAGAAVLRLLVQGVRSGTPGALPVAVGYGAVIASVAAMVHAPLPFFGGVAVIYYGLWFLVVSAIVALTLHVRDVNRRAQEAAAYALEAHARERTRLSRDLHDGLGQLLALLKLHLQRRGRGHEGEAARSFDEGVAQVDLTIDEMRRIARDLRAAPLQDRAFGEAVREYAASMARQTDLEIEVDGDFGSLDAGVGDELYRILQECLTNCLKHSGGRRATVTLAEADDRRTLTVTDDGRGLSDDAGASGLGLATIRERCELLGGACTFGPAPGGGTRIEVSVPR